MPEDIASAVVWLASEASAFVTGHALVVDGGVTLHPGVYAPGLGEQLMGLRAAVQRDVT